MRSDALLKWIVLILVLAGFFILSSASIGLTTKKDLSPYYYVLRQLAMGGALGLVSMAITSRIPYRFWRKFAIPLYVAGLILGVLVLIPSIGISFGGARRWIGFGPVNFQPSEFIKFAYIAYLSAVFSAKYAAIKTFREGLLPFILVSVLAGTLIISEPDVGTFGVMAISGLFLFLAAGGSLKHICLIILAGAVLFSALVRFEPYRLERFKVFTDRTHDPQGSGYQLRQALIAIGSGGIFGRGFGMSRQKFQYLPEPVGDSIFAVAAEEFGFVGSAILVSLFILFAWRGVVVSLEASDSFGRLFGSGIVILIIVQALVNIAALSGLLPLTGIPLPFVSQGGSALAITLAEIGILLNISRARL